MSELYQRLPVGPHLVPKFRSQYGGVDFLGLRQVNLDYMGACIPGINNATRSVRPYAVMCWIYWRFPKLVKDRRGKLVSQADLVRFKEKVESLFLWGHLVKGVGGVPGTQSEPRDYSGKKANLSFKSWGREARNTSLQAPIQYGPSLSDRNGLGFLSQVERRIYRVTPSGEKLALALDKRLRQRGAYEELLSSEMFAAETVATDLFPAWRVGSPSVDEVDGFRECFFDEAVVGEDSALGRRSAMIHSVQCVLRASNAPLAVREIRAALAYRRLAGGGCWTIPAKLESSVGQWGLLQMRQGQRIALESLLVWVEHQVSQKGVRELEGLVAAFCEGLEARVPELVKWGTPAAMLDGWLGGFGTFEDYVQAALKRPDDYCLFQLGAALEEAVKGPVDEVCAPAFKLLLLTQHWVDWFAEVPAVAGWFSEGGAARISVAHWRVLWDKHARYKLADLVHLVISDLVLSQHWSVATQRFDGGTQRMRISLEEEGLEVLSPKPWEPEITRDRLDSLLWLMYECGFVDWDESLDGFVCAER